MDDESLENFILPSINKWWLKGKVPDKATQARVVSLYKKGCPEKQENYRPISLLNTYDKIIAAAIQRRLAKALDPLLSKTQYGFRGNRSTIDAVFVARRLQERRQDWTKGAHAITRLGKSIR